VQTKSLPRVHRPPESRIDCAKFVPHGNLSNSQKQLLKILSESDKGSDDEGFDAKRRNQADYLAFRPILHSKTNQLVSR